MGIIRRQTIKGSIVSYAGAILGLINMGILFPRFFSADQIGLINWIVPIATIVAQFSALGFENVTARLFPYFRNEKLHHNGYLFVLFCVGILGFSVALVAFFLFQPFAKDIYSNSSPLYLDYLIYLIPLVFFTLFFNLLDGYNRVLYDAVSAIFFKDIIFKLLNLLLIILFWHQIIDFSQFVFFYVIALCLPTVLLFLLLLKRQQISFVRNLSFITPKLRKSMIETALFGVFNSFSNKLANQIDRIMIVSYMGLSANGIYATMANFGILISMPSRSLRKISSTVIAEAWKKNDLKTIGQIYSQSGLHQFLLGCLLFVGLWINIDNVIVIVTPKFLPGTNVVFFIGLAHVIQMLSGVNGVIIQNSPHFKIQTYFMVAFALLIFITNAIAIPIWGITGAALASLFSTFCFNGFKYLFLLKKYGFQPFNYRYLLVIFIAIVSYFSACFIPKIEWFVVDIAVRSVVVTVVYIVLAYRLKIAEDFNKMVQKGIGYIGKK